MKTKFADYEEQSEKYYAEMLELFKNQARTAVNKKQKELNALTKLKNDHEAQMIKIRDKVKERKIRAFWSDESESEEEEVPVIIKREETIEDYIYVKASRKQAKVAIIKFVRKFREDNNGQNPTDEDTAPIAMELADFNHQNEKYLDIKLSLIKENKMPFQADEFGSVNKEQAGLQKRATKLNIGDQTSGFVQAQDKFLQTLGQGFGAVAAKSTRQDGLMSPSSKANESRVNQTFD